ncbi:MAG: EamA family transporter, partial [Longimicrobiales bacterium]
LYARALELMPASTAAMLASIEPVVAAVLGWLILGEAIGWDRALGVACVVLAAAGLAGGKHGIRESGNQRIRE